MRPLPSVRVAVTLRDTGRTRIGCQSAHDHAECPMVSVGSGASAAHPVLQHVWQPQACRGQDLSPARAPGVTLTDVRLCTVDDRTTRAAWGCKEGSTARLAMEPGPVEPPPQADPAKPWCSIRRGATAAWSESDVTALATTWYQTMPPRVSNLIKTPCGRGAR